MPYQVPTHLRLPDSNRCIRCVGMWSSFQSQWLQLPWLVEWLTVSIMEKELVPIVISCAIWDPLLTRKRTEIQCDNMSLVTAINKGSTKESTVMYLLCCLLFFTALFNIEIKSTHIASINNNTVEMLYRNQTKSFLLLTPTYVSFQLYYQPL